MIGFTRDRYNSNSIACPETFILCHPGADL